MNKKTLNIFVWIVQIVAAAILLQTLFFKFSGAAESVYIFKTLGIEPVGRIGSGVVELLAGIFLLIPPMAVVGAGLAMGTMTVAIAAHLTKLGIEVMGDKGELFYLALIVWVCCALVLALRRQQVQALAAKCFKLLLRR